MMQIRKTKWPVLAAASLGVMAFTHVASAQSSDALLDKLVEKGILTTKEATELRQEADQNFNEAYKVKTGLPDWVDQLKLYGDFRGRMETFNFQNDAPGALQGNDDRTRYRYRLRFGVTATFKENFEMGFRLTSSEATGNFGGDPISGNTTLGSDASKKFLYMDLAYGKWTAVKSGPWLVSATIGKMENPFTVSHFIFDNDYTPEGAAIQAGYTFNDVHSLKLSGGAFVLNEIGQSATGQASDDPYFLGVQLRHDAKWTPKISTILYADYFSLFNEQNLGNLAVPNISVGNTRYPAPVAAHFTGDLLYDYTPVILGASVTYNLDSFPVYKGAFPITASGEFINNFGADENNQSWWVGITFGKSGKKGTWEVGYRYAYMESDAWYEEMGESDFGAYYQQGGLPTSSGKTGGGYQSGTGVKGNVVKAVYSFTDSFNISVAFWLTELIDTPTIAVDGKDYSNSQARRMQLDANWKF